MYNTMSQHTFPTQTTPHQTELDFLSQMGVSNFLSSLSCELRIIRAKNLDFVNSTGSFFVRYYLSAGKNMRVELNTREISSKSDLFWNETFCLECLGTQDSLNDLKQQSVIFFELRWRSTVPVLGKMRKSRLLGRGEVPWKVVFESENMEVEKWVPMVSAIDRAFEGVKPPSLEVAMKVRAPAMEKVEQKKKRLRNWEGCGCKDSGKDACSFADYDMFALAAVFEGL